MIKVSWPSLTKHQYAGSNQLHLDKMGVLRPNDSVEMSVSRLKKSWKKFKNSKSNNALFYAVAHAFRSKYSYLIPSLGEYFIALSLNFITAIFDLS